MKTALDVDPSILREHERQYLERLKAYGWSDNRTVREGERPDFNSTTGFQLRFNVPELVVFGLPLEAGHAILWDIYNDLGGGMRFNTTQPWPGLINGFDVWFQPVDRSKYREYLSWSGWFYAGEDFDCWQMVWPDKGGHFPWQRDFDPLLRPLQPDLSGANWNGHGDEAEDDHISVIP